MKASEYFPLPLSADGLTISWTLTKVCEKGDEMKELEDEFAALLAILGGTVIDRKDDVMKFAEPLFGPGLHSPELTVSKKGKVLNLRMLASEGAHLVGDMALIDR